MRYIIGGSFTKRIVLEIDDTPPPCLWCGQPVEHPSMDGPLRCGPCDMGKNPDGSDLTSEQHKAQAKHFAESIARYRVD